MTNTKELQVPYSQHITLGCDPEFFFKKGKKIIGAEFVLPKEGLITYQSQDSGSSSKIVIDGVQAELNPRESTCRDILAGEIGRAFIKLKEVLEGAGNEDVTVDFSRAIKMTKKSLLELDLNNQRFGCMPSFNAYKTEHKVLVRVDPLKYLSRSAGGHIHIGVDKTKVPLLHDNIEKVMHMFDILCGNTMVLVDRDISNIKRRELYGRAGEYRLPKHGVEYRTLSNCWMTCKPLFSLAFGLARQATDLMLDANREEYYKAFTSAVDIKDIEKAINTNDYKLALANFKKIEPLLMQVSDQDRSRHPLHSRNIKIFYYFVDKINTKGLNYFFKKDIFKHWVKRDDPTYSGISDYLIYTLSDKYKKDTEVK